MNLLMLPVNAESNGGVEEFVARCYEIALGREPEESGLKEWSRKLREGEVCGVSAAYGFVYSPEFQGGGYDNATYTEKMYNMLLGRESDAEGNTYTPVTEPSMPTPVSDSEAVPTAVPTGDIDNTPTTAPTVSPTVTSAPTLSPTATPMSTTTPTPAVTPEFTPTSTPEPTVTPIVTPTPETKYKVGDIISLGKYDINKDGEKDDIEWIVTDITDGKVLLVTKVFVDYKCFFNTIYSPDVREWCDSDSYKWLNGEFYDQSFSEEEKEKIIETEYLSVSNKAFLLSEEEMLKYEDEIFNADSIEECRKLLYSDVFKNNYWSTVQRYWEEGFIRPAEDTVNKPEDLYMYRLLCRCNRDESGITQ